MRKLESPVLLLVAASLLLLQVQAHAHAHARASWRSMYAFGDSLTDTGNYLVYANSINLDALQGHLPYGETYFGTPTGRFSDGRLVVDFLAKRVGAPQFLQPYLALNCSRRVHAQSQSLVDFAFAGATAQDVSFLNATYNITPYVPFSLGNELPWFSTLPISKDKEALSRALFYFGEIGVNDYTLAFGTGLSVDTVITEFVPNIINIIRNALGFLIHSGAKYIVLEGGYPIGCTPIFTQALFPNATRDRYGCVQDLHRLNALHNQLVKDLFQNLTITYKRDVRIIFFDQVKAFLEILKRPSRYGFTNTMDPCFDILQSTNVTNVQPCADPSKYVNWDGTHFTDATHNALLDLFYTAEFATPFPNFLTR